VHEARPKVGEPQDEVKLGFLPMDASVDPDELRVSWVRLPEAGDRKTVIHGPFWNLEGTRAAIQVISVDHKDVWIAEVNASSGKTKVLAHDRDDAWLGGPPIQVNYFQPALLEWLPGNRLVFASERSGWSHLHLIEEDGSIRALTSGTWEVRSATLSRDRAIWLIQASREHPSEDHLYTLPAAGGDLTRITQRPGRHEGFLSPDGSRLAVVYGESVQLPDLYLRETGASESRRITISGADPYYRYPLAKPEIVKFSHTDGRPLWAALFKPEQPNRERAAVIHIHGGGYRQFGHRGWSVYGYALHLGAINYLVQQGYTVLDFDYRGSAGYGRAYRTDIYRSMGAKDIDGAVTAVDYLVDQHGIDSSRVGIYGISYGGFSTLMALFRYPGVFAAGIANASVTDWAHYNHNWTLRILNSTAEDAEAYERSSPIYHAGGLADPLLIVHGLIDDNVQFQDAARLIQKLIELEKDFEVMVYPAERHTIVTESSRYDYMKRLAEFFQRNLLRR
jgi:dipeptidyl aminopeptidase/acylaminoacyl peptidase